MKEKLSIRKFGPIKEAEIEARDLTIFVGPQATGKSMAAQLLYLMRGLEDLLQPASTFTEQEREQFEGQDLLDIGGLHPAVQSFISTLEWWFGNEAAVYTAEGTALSWNPKAPTAETSYQASWTKGEAKINEALTRRVKGSSSLHSHQVYIPAGRALYSFLPPAYALRLISSRRSKLQWPGYIVTFYEALGAALTDLWRFQHQPTIFEHLSTIKIEFLQMRLNEVLRGEMRYGPDTVLLEVGKHTLRPETIAAGQMEVWPIWAILDDLYKSGRLEMTRFYIEEPEAHLHPGAQRSLMEIVTSLVAQEGQFVITTHSPYVLYTINNSLMVQKVLDSGRDLPSGVSPEVALRPEQVAAYRFRTDGKVDDIMDMDVGLINEAELDQVADDLGASFTDLQEKLGGVL
jgi:hypothetical protein